MDARTTLLKKNILASFLVKGWSAVVVFLLAPVTLLCLDQYVNGVWMTISTMLVWIDTMDIGLGNGLRNKLAEYIAKNDRERAQQATSTTFFTLMLIIFPLTAMLVVMVLLLDVGSLLNVDDQVVPDLHTAIIAAVILFGSTFVFKFIGNVYMALQLPAINNAIIALGQTLTLLMTFVAYYAGWHSLVAIAIVNTASPLLVWILSFPLTFCRYYPHLMPRPKCFRWSMVSELYSLGVQFFVIQISSIVLFMSTNLLISRWFSPEMVTPYNLAYRYFGTILVIFTVVCTPYWSATTDAYQRGDIQWIENANRRMNRIMLCMAAVVVTMLALSSIVYYIWINYWQDSTVTIPVTMSMLTALYVLTLVLSMRYSNFLNGIGALRLQLIMTFIAAVLFVPLAWIAVKLTDSIYALLAVMVLINVPGLIVNVIQFNRILRGKAHGIWSK